jgi:hypothetical protein
MMSLNLRKLAVGFLALGVLVGVFVLYMRFNRTPPIVVGAAKAVPQPVADVNRSESNQQAGKIAGVKIGPVVDTEFIHRNESNQIDRKFGFEELLHKQGNQWVITKPYMWMYLERFSCRVTADQGRIQLVEAFGRAMPTDAEFIGNVMIHVVPTNPSDPWECFIHLDDVGFLAEKSLFSSTGAVRFLSRAVRLTGTGMELIYDGPRSRLEMFRVFDLDSLRMRSSEVKAMADKGPDDSTPSGESGPAAETDAGRTVPVADATERTPTPADSDAPPPDVYRCVLRRNVRLESPDGVVVARDLLSINGIQRSRPEEPDSQAGQTADPNGAPLPAANALNTTASSYPAMSSIPEELYDIVVTCDGGAEITLIGGSPFLAEAIAARVQESAPVESTPHEIDSSDRQQVVARRIDFDFQTNDTTMLGPVAMKFLVDPNNLGEKPGGAPMPMEVTAQGTVRFLAASERIVLEGGSTATLHSVELDSSDEYRLAAPRLTLDLAIDSNTPEDVKVRLRRLVADDGSETPGETDFAGGHVVTVRMWRRTEDKLLSQGALDARELQYDADPDRFVVTGPGVIWLHNAETIRSKNDPNATIEPCWVRLSNFDTLKYWSLSNQIVAEDDSQQLLLDYFPLVDGKYGPQTQVVAGHVEATLQEIAPNRMDLVSLVASQGIEYDSESDHMNFIGSEMVYDRDKSLLTIQGDDARPCYLNGALVDKIVVDPKTRRIEAEVRTPSIFQVRR